LTKTCLIVMDGAGHDDCVAECGYLEGAVEAGLARRWKMRSCLPTISASMYETMHTGLSPFEHGILGNEDLAPSTHPNVFNVLKAAGKTAAIVGHSYFHTLYGGSAFDVFEHAEINDPKGPVAYARYYSMEGYRLENACQPAEIDLCAQAWTLARQHAPDYLLLHSSSPDTLGHFFGGDSAAYRTQVWYLDNAFSRLIPRLRSAGYEVLVTADHGMNKDGHHGGNQPVLRDTAFYHFGERPGPDPTQLLDQRAIAPSILSLIGVAAPNTMGVAALF